MRTVTKASRYVAFCNQIDTNSNFFIPVAVPLTTDRQALVQAPRPLDHAWPKEPSSSYGEPIATARAQVNRPAAGTRRCARLRGAGVFGCVLGERT
ncbi:hypothetical protein GCM10009854_40160 [Saccharopolyspora halophila]|uniref:Uncharacterized protein n=1 Tax=Saccharopolyspora halophila TaxID=405551 RepID=A0ABP5TS54_9PSEU